VKTELIEKLNNSNAHRNSRMDVCDFAIKNSLVNELIQISFDTTNHNHFKAFWALEFVCEKNLCLFANAVGNFCEILDSVKNDSAVRSATKICMFLAISNQSKKGIILTEIQEKRLIESSIDRLIQDEKVASKVYSMKALFILGKKHGWIYDQIKPIISQDAFNHSYAYQASARTILKRLK
jgi:predicted AAA+ superfamily ATPase